MHNPGEAHSDFFPAYGPSHNGAPSMSSPSQRRRANFKHVLAQKTMTMRKKAQRWLDGQRLSQMDLAEDDCGCGDLPHVDESQQVHVLNESLVPEAVFAGQCTLPPHVAIEPSAHLKNLMDIHSTLALEVFLWANDAPNAMTADELKAFAKHVQDCMPGAVELQGYAARLDKLEGYMHLMFEVEDELCAGHNGAPEVGASTCPSCSEEELDVDIPFSSETDASPAAAPVAGIKSFLRRFF